MGIQTRLFRFGDRVRIMQTTEMEERGIANQVGTVAEHQRTTSHLVIVALDDDGRAPNEVELPAYSLMRVLRDFNGNGYSKSAEAGEGRE